MAPNREESWIRQLVGACIYWSRINGETFFFLGQTRILGKEQEESCSLSLGGDAMWQKLVSM